MRLVYDHSPGAYSVYVSCLNCGDRVLMADTVIDIDGPAFQAYYCNACQPEGEVGACTRYSCTRCPGGHNYV